MTSSKNVPASLIDEATSRHGRKQKNKTHNGKVGFFLRLCFHKQKPWTDAQLLGKANQKVNNKLTVRNKGGGVPRVSALEKHQKDKEEETPEGSDEGENGKMEREKR